MSRRTWGITLTVLALAAAVTAVFWYIRKDAVTPPEEQHGTELVEMLPAKTSPDQVSQEEEDVFPFPEEAPKETAGASEYEYLLRNYNGYVAVYQLPENEIYEYTDVIMDILPLGLQEEIHNGKYLKNEEELYNFLENYTS